MKVNKDKGTTVGFSNLHQVVCNDNEHEWISAILTATGQEPKRYEYFCSKCGVLKPMNTVCKEQKTKIMKKANLDGGTSVGFSSDFILSGHENLPQGITTNKVELPVNTVCKEHEWGAEWTTTSVRDVRIICSKCGVSKPQNEIDIKENLKVISDNVDDEFVKWLDGQVIIALNVVPRIVNLSYYKKYLKNIWRLKINYETIFSFYGNTFIRYISKK